MSSLNLKVKKVTRLLDHIHGNTKHFFQYKSSKKISKINHSDQLSELVMRDYL